MSPKIKAFLEKVANLTPATGKQPAQMGAGMLNTLISTAQGLLKPAPACDLPHNPLRFSLEGCKSYASKGALVSKIEDMNAQDLPHLICLNEEGRYTAVFFGPNANGVIFQGFKWVMGYDTHKPQA